MLYLKPTVCLSSSTMFIHFDEILLETINYQSKTGFRLYKTQRAAKILFFYNEIKKVIVSFNSLRWL